RAPRARRRGRPGATRARPSSRTRQRRTDERATPLLSRRPRSERRLARRARRRGPPIDVLSHPAFARLHPTQSHPESQERLAVLLAAFEYDQVEPAPVEAILRCHTEEHVERIRTIAEPTWLDGDTLASETTFEAALLAAGAAIAAVELLLVWAGFGAHRSDPLADIRLSDGAFTWMAERATTLGPCVAAVLEGGYNIETLPRLVAAALEGFSE